ncbi:MAG: hypothetical protein ACYDER_01905 [Ktedonobacteraceae bacterium]
MECSCAEGATLRILRKLQRYLTMVIPYTHAIASHYSPQPS